MSEQGTRSYYDRFSEIYSRDRRHGYFGFVNDLEVQVIADAVPGKSVLEIGCGTGLLLDLVHKLGPAELVGVDISPGMLSDAVEAGHQVVVGSALDLPFPDARFDVAYSFKVLPHVADLKQAIQEGLRVLKPGGRLFIELYNPWSIKRVWDLMRGAASKVHLRHDSHRDVRRSTPPGYELACVAGVRIFGPFSWCYEGALGVFFKAVDRRASRTVFRHIAGYQIYRLRRSTET